MLTKEKNNNKIINRCKRIAKLVSLEAPRILIEAEVHFLNEYFEAYGHYPETNDKTNGDTYPKGSDEEYYEYADYCVSNGHVDIDDWRKMSI